MSDSHDNLVAVGRAVTLFKDAGCDLVIHAGDFVAPFAARELVKAGCPVKAVFGNCDGEKKGLVAAIQPFGEIRKAPFKFKYNQINILVTHLNAPVESYARQKKSDLIIFGHTHEAEIRKIGATLIINPGEAGGWLTGKNTVALFDPATGEARIIGI
ncbi:MAG: metallophosphoesterase [Candidatus Aminicenantes bacterium]|nr:metallophosphoesterase [Candidatus Aminicenantes bacterium]